MRRYSLVPVNAIWFNVMLWMTVAAGLALRGWLCPVMSLPFMGHSMEFSVRMPLLIVAGGLSLRTAFYALVEVGRWLNVP